MLDWMLMPLRRYADFSGRSRRKEYWMFALFNLLLIFGLALVAALLGGGLDPQALGAPIIALFVLYFLAIIVPSIAVQVRRFHDQEKSGWFVLLNFIPYIGGFIVLVFMCLEGTQGENRYGADPKV